MPSKEAPRKKLLIALVVLLVLVVVGAVLLVSNLGSIIQETVETVGSDATQARVTLRKADVSLQSGKAELTDLVVGNPRGFETDHAFSLGGIVVQVDTSTLNQRPIVIEKVVISEPQVTYELRSDGSNMAAIQANVDAYVADLKKSVGSGRGGKGGKGDAGGEPAPKPGSPGEDEGEGSVFVIRDLYIRGGKVSVSASLLKGKSVGADLGEIHLQNIGEKEGGATPAQIAKEVLSALTHGTTDAVGGLGIDGLVDDLKKNTVDRVQDVLKKGVKDLFGK